MRQWRFQTQARTHGLMVGALSTMAPKSRATLAAEVLRAMLAGTLACFATACVAASIYELEPAAATGGAGPAGGLNATGAAAC